MTFLAALYCLLDLFLYVRFQSRFRLSHFWLLKNPLNFWSSGKRGLPLFLLFGYALWHFPLLAWAVILFAPWPHSFLLAFRDLKQKRLNAHFPLAKRPKGEKLFSISVEDRPHLLFLSLESFRAKNVGCLGAKDPLSPHFDALAKKGILFTRFHSTGNLTNRAIIATLFGIPAAHRPWHLGQYADLPLVGLPQILSRYGYQSALIKGGSTAFDHEAEFFSKQGFQTVLGKRDIARPGTSWGVYDESLMPYAASWLAAQNKPTFLNVYTVTNHHPWLHPEGKEDFLRTFAYTDQALALFLEELKKKKLLEKCLLFIYGDHGQELADRDPHFAINRHLYQDNVHVPLLIYGEGRLKPKVIETVSSQIDLLPTVLDLFALPDPHYSLGKSLLRPSTEPIYFSHPFDQPIRGCRQGDWKYLIEEEREELYNLRQDPEERENRIGEAEGIDLREQTAAYFAQLDTYYSVPKEKKESPLHLDLSHSLITDEKLAEIAQAHPHLSSLSLAHCLLLTDQGLAALFQHCPHLEKLNIEGLDEVTGQGLPSLPHLLSLNASHCPRLAINWLLSLPSLQILQIGSSSFTDQDLLSLAHIQKNLSALYLTHLPEITEQSVAPLLQANPYLTVFSLQNCPQVRAQALKGREGGLLRYRFISGCA